MRNTIQQLLREAMSLGPDGNLTDHSGDYNYRQKIKEIINETLLDHEFKIMRQFGGDMVDVVYKFVYVNITDSVHGNQFMLDFFIELVEGDISGQDFTQEELTRSPSLNKYILRKFAELIRPGLEKYGVDLKDISWKLTLLEG